ncbi:MAG: AEC family transporter [Opitutales bacterium]|nr:AEC family transporter [Opitutales bacterium]
METILPVILLLAAGAGLVRWGFFGPGFTDELNKLVYWVALPALIIVRVSAAEVEGGALPRLCGAFFLATLCAVGVAYATAHVARLPERDGGTFVQASFRGNLAFVGIPILVYAFSGYPEAEQAEFVALAVLVFGPTMLIYNLLSVAALQLTGGGSVAAGGKLLFRRLVTNPLILASIVAILLYLTAGPLPAVPARTLEALAALAVPGALLCIGGGLVTARLRGNVRGIVLASVIKAGVLPLLAYGTARIFGLEGAHVVIVLVLAASPTAAASYVLATQMGGNAGLASGAIALSTVLSPLSFFVILLLV